jgi:NitT/TauT family transport system permease protein
MTDSTHDNLSAASLSVPTLAGMPVAALRHWGLVALTCAVLVLIVVLMTTYQTATAETPAMAQSTLGPLSEWLAARSAEDNQPALLGQLARQQALAAGLDRLDPVTVSDALRKGLVAYLGVALVIGIAGLVAQSREVTWTRRVLLVVLLALDALVFIIPPLDNDSAQLMLFVAIALLLLVLLFAPGKVSTFMGAVVVFSSLMLAWEAAKAVGGAVDYKVTAPQPGWNYTTYATLDEMLTNVQSGAVKVAIVDENDVENLIAPYPEEGADAAATQYPDLRMLSDLDTDANGLLGLPVIPPFPGRLVAVVPAADAETYTGIGQLLGQPVGTYTGAFSLEKFLNLPRSLVLLDLKITNDLNLPHLQSIANALWQPARRNGDLLLGRILADSGWFTWTEAAIGFTSGALLGFLLGVLFAHSGLLERGLLPFVVASQTVPILAVAPMVVIWLGAGPASVAVISAYLTFFPVTINTLRGLTSPHPTAIELMQSYAATRWTILWKLRFPASLPYIFTALKVSATASVVGAIIGELPSGVRGGLGGAILNFNSYYVSDPTKLWAAILIAALVGIAFFVLVSVVERLVLGRRVQAE